MALGEKEVGPAYYSEGSVDLAGVQNDLDILNNKVKMIENMIGEKEWLEKNEYNARTEKVEERLDSVDSKVNGAIETMNRCDETSLTNKYALIGVNNQLQEVINYSDKDFHV